MSNNGTRLGVRKNYYLTAFLWGLALATLIFLPWILWNKGYFFFYGDFNVQQIPFYQMIHDEVRNGNIGWSYTTDLGANIIGSYSFYMIGSPFFWITLPFPSSFVPYMIAPLLILKFAFASLAAYTFLRRYVKNQYYAVIGALLYAFSGFGIYNIFFNHFHEAMITFPFMLAAVDNFIYEKKKGHMAFAVFASAFVNYYFFAGQAVFVFIYWFVRMRTGSFKMSVKEFLRFALEVVSGFLCAGIVLVPSVLAVIQNSRVNNFPNGWGAVVYTSEQRYMHILESFFFPPDMPAYANFTPDSNAKWASVAGWLPLFSMVGVFSFYKLKTHKWLRVFIPVLFVMAFIPIFNSFFQLLNVAYYARWFYMLTLMLSLATILCLDSQETDYSTGLKVTFGITMLITCLIGLMPTTTTDTKGVASTTYGIEKYPDRFWIWVGIAFVGLIALTFALNFRKAPKAFPRMLSATLSVLIILYGNVLVGVGVVNSSYKYKYISTYAIGNRGAFKELKDIKSVRSDFYEEMDNMGMYWQIPTIQAFQSIVPGSVMDYYKSIGVERSVGSRPDSEVYAIRSFLSCKYLFDNITDSKDFANKGGTTKMPGWKFLKTKKSYKIYENEYYIPYGFTYDTYVTTDEYNDCTEKNRSILMLESMVLTKEQAKKYADILEHDDKLSDHKYTQVEYFNACNERKKLACSSVKFENNQFTAKIKTGDTRELVFFSIPYEDGWSATVNGKSVDVEKVNVGFMAVAVPANTDSTIVFTYRTPGIIAGIAVTAGGIIILALYLILYKSPKKREDTGILLFDDLGEGEFDKEINDFFETVKKEKKEKKPKKQTIKKTQKPVENTENVEKAENAPEKLMEEQNRENEQMNNADIMGQVFSESDTSSEKQSDKKAEN